ncbi:MAG: hypothetical protein SaAmV1_gp1 [Sanya amalgavirus 1]|nr:MAG: hypothetical protein SaAmV1_gp1 [Sanya amalgavirus 1]
MSISEESTVEEIVRCYVYYSKGKHFRKIYNEELVNARRGDRDREFELVHGYTRAVQNSEDNAVRAIEAAKAKCRQFDDELARRIINLKEANEAKKLRVMQPYEKVMNRLSRRRDLADRAFDQAILTFMGLDDATRSHYGNCMDTFQQAKRDQESERIKSIDMRDLDYVAALTEVNQMIDAQAAMTKLDHLEIEATTGGKTFQEGGSEVGPVPKESEGGDAPVSAPPAVADEHGRVSERRARKKQV